MTGTKINYLPAPQAHNGAGILNSASSIRLAFFAVYFGLNATLAADSFVVLLSVPTFLVCCYNVWRIESAYATVEDMIWLVIYLFFVIAPCQSLSFGYLDASPASGVFFTREEVFEAFAIIFVFVSTATIVSRLVKRFALAAAPRRYELKSYSIAVLFPLNLVSFVAFVIAQGGLSAVLADRYSKEEWSPIANLAMDFQILSCLLIWVYAMCKQSRSDFVRIAVGVSAAIALGALLVSQNPYNTARFVLIIAWMPILLVYNRCKLSIRTFFASALFGLVVAMPMLNQTSRNGSSLAEAAAAVDLSSVIRIPGLDVFDMLLFEVKYLEGAGYYWGSKTLSIILFFVPRSIWTGKATIVAGDMGEKLIDWGTAGTGNLSNFVAGDFYADLGIVGVAIGAAAVAFVLTFFGLKRPVLVHGLDLRAIVFMSSVPILVRGTLSAVISLTVLALVYLALLTRVLGRRLPP